MGPFTICDSINSRYKFIERDRAANRNKLTKTDMIVNEVGQGLGIVQSVLGEAGVSSDASHCVVLTLTMSTHMHKHTQS